MSPSVISLIINELRRSICVTAMKLEQPDLNDAMPPLVRAKQAIKVAAVALDQIPTAAGPAREVLTPRDRALLWLAAYQRRLQMQPELNEGSWAILMDLFVNKGVRRISISSACIASCNPPTTALRWIRRLIAEGLITREEDEDDGRRMYLFLTEKGEAAVLQHLCI